MTGHALTPSGNGVPASRQVQHPPTESATFTSSDASNDAVSNQQPSILVPDTSVATGMSSLALDGTATPTSTSLLSSSNIMQSEREQDPTGTVGHPSSITPQATPPASPVPTPSPSTLIDPAFGQDQVPSITTDRKGFNPAFSTSKSNDSDETETKEKIPTDLKNGPFQAIPFTPSPPQATNEAGTPVITSPGTKDPVNGSSSSSATSTQLKIETPVASQLKTETPEESQLKTETPEASQLKTETPQESQLKTETPAESPLKTEIPEEIQLKTETPKTTKEPPSEIEQSTSTSTTSK